MKIVFKFKITIVLTVIITLIFIGIFILITQNISKEIEFNISQNFERIQSDFNKDQKIFFNQLRTSCYLLKNEPVLYEYIENETIISLHNKIENIVEFLNSDIFVILDKNNKNIFNHGTTNSYNAKNKTSILLDKPDTTRLWSGYKKIDNNLYRAATAPLIKNNKYYGLVLLGLKIFSKNVLPFAADLNIDATIFHEYRFIASTTVNSITDSIRTEFADFVNEHRPVFDAVFSTQLNSGIFSTQFNFQKAYALIFPAGKGSPIFIMLTIPKSIAFQQIETIQKNIIIAACISAVLFFILGLMIDRKMKGSTAINDYRINFMRNAPSTAKNGSVIICTDISGLYGNYTEISTDEFINKQNRYLNLQNEIIELYEGTLYQIPGDKFIALFKGADGVERAIECAIKLQKIIKKEFHPEKALVRIGINFGRIDKNNTNNEPEKEFLPVGPAINLCGSLCALAKPGQILIRRDLLDNITIRYKMGKTQALALNELKNKTEFAEILYNQKKTK